MNLKKITFGVIIFILIASGIAGILIFNNFNSSDKIDDLKLYLHPQIRFSLKYSQDLEVISIKESDVGETIIFQKETDTESMSADQKTGFQVFVVPFEDDGSGLTKEKILKDLPGIVIEDLLGVVIGEKAERPIHAFVFWSNDARIGKTREVWFVDNGYLFEITTYEHLDSWLASIMSTWSCCG